MPPQQPDRPLDVLDDGLRFRAHFSLTGEPFGPQQFEAGM